MQREVTRMFALSPSRAGRGCKDNGFAVQYAKSFKAPSCELNLEQEDIVLQYYQYCNTIFFSTFLHMVINTYVNR